MLEVICALGGLVVGLLIGSNNPVRVKLVADKIEDVVDEARDVYVEKAVEKLRHLRKR